MTQLYPDSASSHPDSPPQHDSQVMNRLCIRKLPRVGIIGAGVSGLRCADVLLKAGVQVTVLEARNRVGGRVHQVENGGLLVDTGANWIHGTEGNPIMKLAEETGTIVMDPEEDSVVIDRDGVQRSAEESGVLSSEFWDSILRAFKFSDEHSKDTDVHTSLSEWLEEEWKGRFKDPARVRDLVDESKMWGQFVGSPIERQSLKFFFLEEGLEGGNVFVADSYRKILGEIARPVTSRGDDVLQLNTEVKHIEYRSEDDTVEPVKVTTTTGKTYTFDEVVVTCPLGWLKTNHKATLTPALPPRLISAIENIGYGALEKLYISFPRAFWLDKNDTHSTKGNTATDPDWPCFTNFHSPTYHPISSSKNSTSWNQSVVSLAHLPSGAAHPTLLFYMTGDSGQYLTTAAKDLTPHSLEYDTLLTSFAEPFYSRLANYDASNSDCKPTSLFVTTWQHDKLAGNGSYSTFRTGLAEGDKDIECMRETGGLSEKGRGLWLAGEHTAPFVALGTTTGAWWSGERVAKGILGRYGLNRRAGEMSDEFEKQAMEGKGSDEEEKTMRQID